MEFTTLVVLISLLALVVATSKEIWRRRCFLVQYPPAPKGLPLVGHLHMLGSLPHRSLANLSTTFGPLFSLRLGSLPAIIVSSPPIAKLILHTHDIVFSGRPCNFAVPCIASGGPNIDIAFSLPGPFWKLMRQLCFSELFSAKQLSHFKPVRAQELRCLLLSIFDAQGTAVSIRENLHRTSMNLISRMALSKSLQEISEEIPNTEGAMAAVLELFGMVGEFNVGDYMPWLAWMDLQGYERRSKRAARITRTLFQEVIDRRRRGCSNDDERPRDFLDVLLLASLNANDKQPQIGDDNMKAVLIDMFAAGTDTSSVAIEWALAELLINPQILMTLQEELDKIVGRSRLVQETDLPSLPYLQAVVNETFRLHPVAPLLVPHMSMAPSQICGYQIPKDTLVFVNAWAIHRDPSVWDNPLRFSPERFLDSNTNEFARQCKFLPFGSGRRMCPGATLGLLNVQTILANLVHAFEWKTLAKPELKEKFGITLTLHEPLVTVPMPRLPKDLLHTFM